MPGATSTTQYALDFSNNDLVMIDPMTGVITPIGDLGPSPGPLTGFDITRDGMGFFASGPFFHIVNLTTGNAPSAGSFQSPLFVKGLAAVPPTPSTPGRSPSAGRRSSRRRTEARQMAVRQTADCPATST